MLNNYNPQLLLPYEQIIGGVRGVLRGGEIPPLNKIYKRIDEIAPKTIGAVITKPVVSEGDDI